MGQLDRTLKPVHEVRICYRHEPEGVVGGLARPARLQRGRRDVLLTIRGVELATDVPDDLVEEGVAAPEQS